tara:strand:- start:5185 stop:5790 length:606 start_codon:yes stop_codon:yes gene_type:complete
MPESELLIVFVKNPILGTAKTRLAQTVGDENALEIYLELLEITKKVVLSVKSDKEVWMSRRIDENDMWEESSIVKRVQRGDGLGGRMSNAFKYALKEKKYAKVVVIGSDCPDITSETIESAFTMLDEKEVVFGPASDGGYYLIGMKNFYPELFKEITWSVSSVLENSIKKLKEMETSFALLKELSDVDTYQDWERFLNNRK